MVNVQATKRQRMLGLPRFRQCAAMPFQDGTAGRRFLLITSLDTKRWIIPKGNIEPGLSARESAELEAFEEAGVTGKLHHASVGSYAYRKEVGDEELLHHVKVFPLEVSQELKDYPHSQKRKRMWVAGDKAADLVDEMDLKKMILKFSTYS